MPKGDKMDVIVQRTSEIGVSAIVPVLSQRTVARPDRERAVALAITLYEFGDMEP